MLKYYSFTYVFQLFKLNNKFGKKIKKNVCMWRKKEKSKSIRINTKPKSSSFKIISSRKIILYKSVRIPKKLYNKHQKK